MTPTGSSYLSQVILAHVTGHVTPTGNYHSTIFWVEKCNTKVKAQYKEGKRKRKKEGDYSAESRSLSIVD